MDTGHVAHEEPRNPATGEVEDTDVGFPGPEHHIAEQSASMRVAMAVLALGALFAGFVQIPGVDNVIANFLDPVFADSPLSAIHPSTGASWLGLAIGAAVSLSGIGIAYWLYVVRPELPGELQRRFAGVHRFLSNKWYFDELIDILVVRPALAIGRFANQTFERFVVDGIVTGTADTVRSAGGLVRLVQSGFVRSYALLLVAGFAGLALYFLLLELMTNFLLWTPLAFGLVGLFLPRRLTGWWATLGAAVTLGIAIAVLAGFDSGASGLQDTVDVTWISGLGVDYSLGVDGLNVFLILLTAVLWTAATAFAAFREQDRPHLFFLMMLLAETAVLGSFLSQDLLLFVLFFDLMLVPFYFLFGAWGSDREDGPTAVAATTKMIVYTLVGSLLMLVGAIATAIIAADGGHITFSIAELAKEPLAKGSQQWIFWFFAVAFLVKMPAFLLHGWMPDAYRAAPLPVLAVFSGVLAKVGAYGFLRVVLPLFPEATVQYQEVVLVIALASILYGSVMAFTQTNIRLVAGYSSVAQLGFITAGIFALSADGSDGAVLQMVNHGLVVAPLFIIIALLAERSGTEDLTKMGGMAMRAPVLAGLFLIVTLATLAMPGSANFIGEFYILNGLFDSKIVFAIVASSGIAMSAYYALRLYQRTMHNRRPEAIGSREISLSDGLVLAPLVLCIIGLAFYPQLILKRTDTSVQAAWPQWGADWRRSLARHRGRGSEGQSISVSSGPSDRATGASTCRIDSEQTRCWLISPPPISTPPGSRPSTR